MISHWRVFTKYTKKDNAEALFNRIAERIEGKCDLIDVEEYYKGLTYNLIFWLENDIQEKEKHIVDLIVQSEVITFQPRVVLDVENDIEIWANETRIPNVGFLTIYSDFNKMSKPKDSLYSQASGCV